MTQPSPDPTAPGYEGAQLREALDRVRALIADAEGLHRENVQRAKRVVSSAALGAALSGTPDIEHVDGVPWYAAPLPRRLHFCHPQSTGWSGLRTKIQRCACGAARLDGDGPWINRNERRKR